MVCPAILMMHTQKWANTVGMVEKFPIASGTNRLYLTFPTLVSNFLSHTYARSYKFAFLASGLAGYDEEYGWQNASKAQSIQSVSHLPILTSSSGALLLHVHVSVFLHTFL